MTPARSAVRAAVCGAVLTGAALVAGVPGAAAGQDPTRREGPEEAPLTLLYRPYVRTIVTALQRDGAFYLPLGETFTQLQIDNHVDPGKGTADGYFISKRRPYHVDFRAGAARVGDRAYAVSPNDFLVTELDVFVLPSVLEQLFGLRAAIDGRMLAVEITSSEELPIAETIRRRERQALLASASDTTAAPLRYARERRAVDGGVVEYLLAAESVEGSEALRFHVGGGGELLGGDLQGSVQGSYGTERRRGIENTDWRWRYVFGESRGVSQLTVGRLLSRGLVLDEVEGVEMTNQPLEPRGRLGAYVLQGVTEPNAEVELYLNDRLIDVGRADPLGEYRFTVPLSYGTTIVRVQSYGSGGAVRREEQVLQVPFNFVPRGRADYTLRVGRSHRTKDAAADASVAVGLSDRLTSTVGVDYRGSDSVSRPLVYGSLSARTGSGYIVGIDFAPKALYRVAAEALLPSRASAGATITRYLGDPLLRPAGASDEWFLRAFAPVGGGVTAATLQLRAGQRFSRNDWRTSDFALEARAQAGPVRPLLGYDWTSRHARTLSSRSTRQSARVGGAGYVGRIARGPRWLSRMLLTGWQTYDLSARRCRELQLNITTPLAVGRYIEGSLTRDYATRANHLDLQFLLELPYLRSSTRASRRLGRETLVQSVRGAVGYDSRSRAFVASDRAWAGHSAVAMRFFLDRDGDGKFDSGDEPVRGATIRLRHPVSLADAGAGLLRATDLPPYRRYSASVDVSGVRNPLWMPKFRDFAFVTDPNRYKRIDVPFFVGGVVEGTVVRRLGAEDHAVQGLKLHIRGVGGDFQTDVPTFADGTFYYMGVPPGQYVIEVDAAQLQLLGLVAQPAERRFEVRETATGDFVERLDFVLTPPARSDVEPIRRPGSATAGELAAGVTLARRF
jgi:hypothetical protein